MTEVEVVDAEIVEDMTEAEAKAITKRIENMRAGVESAYRTYIDLVTRAYERRAWVALGYESWEAYARENVAVKFSREDRQFVVVALTAAEMSTRSIGAALGVSNKTIHQDQQQALPPGNTSRTVTGADNKKYSGIAKSNSGSRDPEFGPSVPGNVEGAVHPVFPGAQGASQRRSPLPDSFARAMSKLEKAVATITNLAADDRFDRNIPNIEHYWNLLRRLDDDLTDVSARINPLSRRATTVNLDTGEVQDG